MVLLTATALAVAVFLAYEPAMSRLRTLWTGTAYRESGRMFLVSSAWRVIKSFPIWGTGYGTFHYLEPLYSHTSEDVGWSYYHAHNEYLEGMIEGGVGRLCLTLAAIALVYHLGLRALAARGERVTAALGLGAIFAFSTMAIHSFGEFGLYIPAITLLATVIAALLCGLPDAQSKGMTKVPQWSCWGAVPVAGGAACMALAILFVLGGLQQARVESVRHPLATADVATLPLEYRAECLDFALSLVPSDAEFHAEIAQVHQVLSDKLHGDDARRHRQTAVRHFLWLAISVRCCRCPTSASPPIETA